MNQTDRRSFFKKLGLGLASVSYYFSGLGPALGSPRPGILPKELSGHILPDDLSKVNDRVWIGEKYWAIPMEDWQVKGGRIEFSGVEKNARVHFLTSVIREGEGEFTVSADMGLLNAGNAGRNGGAAGFEIGIRDETDPDVKAACYFGKGLPAGISTKGHLLLGTQAKALPANFDFSAFSLTLKGKTAGKTARFTLTCRAKDGGMTELVYQAEQDVSGLVALVNNLEAKGGEPFWFKNSSVSGTKIAHKPGNSFGPVLWAMHTLSKGKLKITAQMPPLGAKDHQYVDLYFKQGNTWKKSATQKIEEAARIALFELDGWDSGKDVPYRLVYQNQGKSYGYEGTIRQEPLGRPLRFGGLTCQEWAGFPYSPLVKNLGKHNPDMLYFSGDQLYEGNGGYPIKRQPESTAILSYLGKWYMFGWAFGDLMRDRPAICTPDDHDVFQGNLWGHGGRAITEAEWRQVNGVNGGYVQTPGMVNVVGKTQCGHLPTPFHPQPLPGGIQPWYTDLVYGKISFAIISDRMFKSGPGQVRSENGGKRLDFVTTRVGKNELEKPGLEFLGQRQMAFLNHWVQDWGGSEMKVLLSQTLFANVGTHHGPNKMFLEGDMDSGGWPKQQKDDVIRLMRKGFAFHINGDQHLPFIVQYSLGQTRDAGWTFCTPAISTGYSRWGQPDLVKAPFTDRPAHNLPHTGVYQDVFGSPNFVYAVGNPKDKPTKQNRYQRAQDKASGFGLVTFNTGARTIKMEAFRFLADKDKPGKDDQFPGWPLTIQQTDNDGRKASGYLPALAINKPDQLVKIIDEDSSELVNIIRIKGTSFQPKVYGEGRYKIVVGEGKAVKEFTGLKPGQKISKEVIRVVV
ncbi:MAG: alkaline phosphatase D family protein [Adhaeribacter sp.]